MDLTEIRRRMLQMIGGVVSVWNQKTVTVPTNMTTTSEVKNWLETNGVIPDCDYGFIIINKPVADWIANEFFCGEIIKGSATLWNGSNGSYYRARGSTVASRYIQNRSITNNEECVAIQNTEYTIFYQ